MPANPQTQNQRFTKAPEILLRHKRPEAPDILLVKARLESSGYAEKGDGSDDG